jgi:hypothetical protein
MTQLCMTRAKVRIDSTIPRFHDSVGSDKQQGGVFIGYGLSGHGHLYRPCIHGEEEASYRYQRVHPSKIKRKERLKRQRQQSSTARIRK